MSATHPRIELMLEMAGLLELAALGAARTIKRQMSGKKSRKRKGCVLKTGADTPLWNELLSSLRAIKWKHGEKAILGRILGVPRQRVNDYIVSGRAMPDAERTLLLLTWLAARRRGVHLG